MRNPLQKKKRKALANFQEEYSHKQLERQKTWNIISKLKNRGENQSVYNSFTISTIGDQLIVWVSYPKQNKKCSLVLSCLPIFTTFP